MARSLAHMDALPYQMATVALRLRSAEGEMHAGWLSGEMANRGLEELHSLPQERRQQRSRRDARAHNGYLQSARNA
jgi:hypothetical protein